MNPTTLIRKKREGEKLTRDEIQAWIQGYVEGQIADYHMAAWAMAVCLRGMDAEEIAALTLAMARSGDSLERAQNSPLRIDKHSTGGLGDKISLILAPLLASCGLHVPMISGRGLGITGGTLDKLQSIPGVVVDYPIPQTQRLLTQAGCFIISASDAIAPADRRLYALRDVTATVESVALITASILSKKLAASLDALVMDVKVGSGAFMRDLHHAEALASSLCRTGAAAGLRVSALITDMNQPLGSAVGNALEIHETLETLAGRGPADVRELTLTLGIELLTMTRFCDSAFEARNLLTEHLDSGKAREFFDRMITAQGGKLDGKLPLAPRTPLFAARDGYLAEIDCQRLGTLVVDLGGGRYKLGEAIDHGVGVEVHARIGDRIEKGQPLASLYCRDQAEDWLQVLGKSFRIEDSPATPLPLIHRHIASPPAGKAAPAENPRLPPFQE